jgi:hypothetical protein
VVEFEPQKLVAEDGRSFSSSSSNWQFAALTWFERRLNKPEMDSRYPPNHLRCPTYFDFASRQQKTAGNVAKQRKQSVSNFPIATQRNNL